MSRLFPPIGMQYWDDFELRAHETVDAIVHGQLPPLRRLSLHSTSSCNFGCDYCSEKFGKVSMTFEMFEKLVREYSEMGGGIIHTTGGEPTVIKGFADFIREAGKYPNIAFHLNTNLYSRIITDDLYPFIQRLKVSLDTVNAEYFNTLVNRKNAFERVTDNLDRVNDLIGCGKTDTIVSLTYTTTKENYRDVAKFLDMYYKRWPNFYAVFFSAYKGTNERFALSDDDIAALFNDVVPDFDAITDKHGDPETKFLFHASHEPRTFRAVERFPEVREVPCHLQLSELVINEDGGIWNCSHLFRDKVPSTGLNIMDGHLRDIFAQAKGIGQCVPLSDKCLYGCNKKLTTFNDLVQSEINKVTKKAA